MTSPDFVQVRLAGGHPKEVPEVVSGEIPVVIRVSGEEGALAEDLAREMKRAPKPLPPRIDIDPERVQEDLARLVLSLINLLRRLLENQAIRRMDRGSLTDEQIERMSEAFWRLDCKLHEMCALFGLKEEDLGIDLGPIEDLL